MRTVRSYFYGLLLPYILQGARLLQEKFHIPSNIISQQSTILTIYIFSNYIIIKITLYDM